MPSPPSGSWVKEIFLLIFLASTIVLIRGLFALLTLAKMSPYPLQKLIWFPEIYFLALSSR